MHDYSSLAFWEKRYTNEHLEIFEWYQTFESLREKIIDYFKPEYKILNVGCGTSKFAEDLFYEGIKNVTNIDFSESAIKLLEEHFEEQQIESKCIKMDVLDMKQFQEEEFNIVFDKALLDSILCGENALETVKTMIKEIYRVNSGKLFDESFTGWGCEDQFLGVMCGSLGAKVCLCDTVVLSGKVGGDELSHPDYLGSLQHYINRLRECNIFPHAK